MSKDCKDSGEKCGYATEKAIDEDFGRRKDMRDAEEKLETEEMMGEKAGPTST